MKVVIVCKSDSTGGAAVVSRRLMEAMRLEGVDARMLVAEKLTDSPYIKLIASPLKIKAAFIADRLPVAFANGFDRSSLFKIDTASAGVDISRDPWVRGADAICLNWINQGVLSLKGIEKIRALGKPVFWTMHDMWCFTGICHHAGECERYKFPGKCGDCPLLGSHASEKDISAKTIVRKQKAYDLKGGREGIGFVAVSNWLAERARESTLLGEESCQKIHVIPNAFPIPAKDELERFEEPDKLRLVFGAARLDDDVKGFPILIEAMRALRDKYPEVAEKTELTLFGSIKNPALLDEIAVKIKYEGVINNPERIKEIYLASDIVVSTSYYETLPGTLIEGQAYGCFPVSFPRGGQSDIISDGKTGWLAEWDDDLVKAGGNIAEGIIRGYEIAKGNDRVNHALYANVMEKFSSEMVARKWIALIKETIATHHKLR